MEAAPMTQDDHIQTLRALGLTLLQAKTYLALAKLENAEVKTIAKTSNMARQDTYRVMPTLEKLGLAEKIIATPTMYKATPLSVGLSTLLQRKTEDAVELQKKTNELINDFKKKNTEITHQKDEPQFIITSEKALFKKRIAEAIDAAQKSNDVIFAQEGFQGMLFYHLQHVKRAMKRGVKIRVITEKPENQQLTQRSAQRLLKNPLFKLKYVSDQAPVYMVTFDNREVNLCIADGAVPSFWSNHPNIVKLAANYFDDLWSKADDEINADQKLKRGARAKPKQPQTANSQPATNLITSSSCIGAIAKST
jgi:sugar-specific transcriptional regulator TrmB